MERDKKLRSVTRTRFTKVVNVLNSEISKPNADLGVIKDQFSKLKDIDCKLKDLDQKMLDHLMLADAEEDTLNCEIEEAEHYSDTFITLERRVRELIDSDNKIDVKSLGSSNGSLMAKSYKLPKIEMRKFDGELINWLPFWEQFEKIHEDTELHDADKFHYLVQSMQSNTRARELIESYPQTAENYAKAVQALKQRYGQKDLLVEIYVRELLKLMMANVRTPPDERRSVAKLYDKLETQLRSLESLGVDTKENTAWLFPMIESCLPEDVMVAWQRSPLNNYDASKNSDSNSSSRLKNLLDFLRREVEGEERRLLARRGFEGSSPKEKLRNKFKQNSDIPTAAGLFSAKEMGCLFCENNHQSKDCITAQSMPFKDKRARIYEKRCCLKCLKLGYLAKACKRTVRCNICAKGHYVLLCPDLPCNRKEKTHVSEVVQSALANQQCTGDVPLMTLMVNIMGNNGYRRVRALLDPGSQKSYILESTALEVKLKPVGNVNIAHSLFGGTQTETKCHKLEEDKIVHQHFLNTVHQQEDGRFCVGLPWLGNQEGIPSNRHIAERRLFNTTRKLRAKCIFSEYDRVFQEWLSEGVIEKVSPEDLNRNCHYLPHHPVVKANSSTTKIRPVFDASCKDKGNLSLNDCLASGPNVIEQIPAILLKFREKAIGVIADIRKAFLQIEVKEEDRDYLRFLWWKNNHQIQVFRHKRVVFGVTCSPYLLGAVILHHLKGVSSEFGALPQKLMECLYIDNCVTSVDTEAELVDMVEKSTEIFVKAKMDLRMWQFGPIHRVKEVYSRLPPSVDIERSEEASVLGMKRDLLEDTLNVTPKFGVIINSLSKRDLLSHTQQIFDPIGFLAPVLLPAKLLIQQAWTVKTDWDEPLPSTIQENFMKWYSELDTLADIKIPRRVGHGIRAHWSIHIFCDASQSAYAAAAFLRCPENKGVSVQLLMAKSRLGPLKKTTIPRMELLACMLGVRLGRYITESLNLAAEPVYYWTDSTTALSWIKTNRQWGTFVNSRVKEICNTSDTGVDSLGQSVFIMIVDNYSRYREVIKAFKNTIRIIFNYITSEVIRVFVSSHHAVYAVPDGVACPSWMTSYDPDQLEGDFGRVYFIPEGVAAPSWAVYYEPWQLRDFPEEWDRPAPSEKVPRSSVFGGRNREVDLEEEEVELQPALQHLRAIGCETFVHVPKQRRNSKLQPRATEGILVGYSLQGRGWRIWIPEKRQVVEFKEEILYKQPKRERDTLPSVHFSSKEASFQEESNADQPVDRETEELIGTTGGIDQLSETLPENLRSHPMTLRSHGKTAESPEEDNSGGQINATSAEDNNPTYEEAMNSPEVVNWIEAIEEERESLERHDVWQQQELPKGVKPLKCRWVLNKKINAVDGTTRYKARLVAKGFTQRRGIDYNEVYTPVSSFETIRLLTAIATEKDWFIDQFDVKSAYLHGTLNETIYMEQPECFKKPGEENLFCKLKKSIYGLKQSGRCWNKFLNKL
ncbi:hypothetical protein LAZ67_6003792 [Cordylochernes scorpioides]|uniref:Gag-pol polyprotein n=1 Tax=Cordylochernes scorpioides TaxID=51811 RepID=A0ABY6KP17_9ARAC|nr:hypothetical protein LAZ67_6003792 [Cordylochernes scorpioides]